MFLLYYRSIYEGKSKVMHHIKKIPFTIPSSYSHSTYIHSFLFYSDLVQPSPQVAQMQHSLTLATASDARQKQLAEFLVSENETVGNIPKRMQKVYVEDTVDHSTVSQLAERTPGKGRHTKILNCSKAAAGDKIWLHHSEPETKRQSMKWIMRILRGRRNSKLGFRQEKS